MIHSSSVAPLAGVLTYIKEISPVQEDQVVLKSLSVVTQHQEGLALRAVIRSSLYPTRLFEFFSPDGGDTSGTIIMYNAVDKYTITFEQ